MADAPGEKECCRRTRERWMARIRAYYTSFGKVLILASAPGAPAPSEGAKEGPR